MSIESLKQQARKHEQNEEWKKALDLYEKALAELARDDQVDIGLYNRVGDLFVRVGQLDKAVDHYEKAVELYREAYLPNNAIAVCKKVIRNVPARHKAYLVIGQIRAEQGFLPDARTNFLTYAERMQRDGDLDESFRALVEFCDLAPDDVGVRITVAEQMAAKGRTDDAVEQFALVYGHYKQLGDHNQAEEVKSKIFQLDPDANLDLLPTSTGFGAASSGDGDPLAAFGEISLGGDPFGDSSEEEVSFASESAMEEASTGGGDDDFDLGGSTFDLDSDEEEADALPMIGFDDDSGADAAAEPLPVFEDDGAEAELAEPLPGFDEEEAEPLSTLELDGEPSDEEAEAEPLPILGFEDDVDGGIEAEPLPTFGSDDPEADGAELPMMALDDAPADEEDRAGEAPELAPQPSTTPAAPASPAKDEGYIDLGAMILGDRSKPKSTRFTVAYEEPSGDEAADFAKMLSQFKEKVSENLDNSDVRAHYDLGTAYKEMGLLDEAISSFQAALRASADHLPTYELMGQTFLEMGQPEAAVRSLERAVESARTVEDELVGIYYYLGRAYEALDNKASAVEFYDRVFALDINFADVTERLRELR